MKEKIWVNTIELLPTLGKLCDCWDFPSWEVTCWREECKILGTFALHVCRWRESDCSVPRNSESTPEGMSQSWAAMLWPCHRNISRGTHEQPAWSLSESSWNPQKTLSGNGCHLSFRIFGELSYHIDTKSHLVWLVVISWTQKKNIVCRKICQYILF